MKICLIDDDPAQFTRLNYRTNMGSFAQIIHNINDELKRRGLYAEPEEADWVGFASGINVNFGFEHKKRFLINVWEYSTLPEYLIQARRALEGPNYKWLGLSRQVTNLYKKYGFENTPIVDIGVDTKFWSKELPKPYYVLNERFKLLSVTANNHRSNVDQIVKIFKFLSTLLPNKYELTIKDTDDRNVMLAGFCNMLKEEGHNINYICERSDERDLKQLMAEHHLLLYLPTTSAGLPILNAASLRLPCIVLNASPTNIYPTTEKINCEQKTLAFLHSGLTRGWELPNNIPHGWLDKDTTTLWRANEQDLLDKIEKIRNNYLYYLGMAEANRREIENKWTWKHSTDQLIKALND